MSDELHVALASDTRYFPGLLVAATSAAFFADRSRRLTLHIFDGGLSNAAWDRLVCTIARAHRGAVCRRLDVSRAGLGRFRDNGKKSPMVYARLLLPELVEAARVVYMDCDFLVLSDLSVLADRDMESDLALAVVDPMVRTLGNDCPWLPRPGLDSESPYFNSGFLVIDLAGWRAAGIAARALEVLEHDATRCTYWDQTALNYVLAGRVGWLDRAWNYPNRVFALEDAGTTVRAIHYLDHNKPWLRGCGTEAHALWRAFARTVAGLDSRELGWRVRSGEIHAAVRQRSARLLALWFAAQARLGRATAGTPAAYWRGVADAADFNRARAEKLRQWLDQSAQGWTARLTK